MIGSTLATSLVKSLVGSLAKFGFDQAKPHLLKPFKPWILKRHLRAVLPPALEEVFHKLPEIEQPDAATRLFPKLHTELAKLATPTGEPDYAAIGRLLNHPTLPSDVVGTLLAEAVLRQLLEVETLWPVLALRETYVSLRYGRMAEALKGHRDAVTAAVAPLLLDAREEVERALRVGAPNLLEWPQVLPDGRWLERPELATLIAKMENAEASVTVLLGGPGSGKSALLARLGTQFSGQEGVVVLPIKADQLELTVGTETDLAHALGLQGPFTETVRRLARDKQVVMLVDQMDAVADLVDLTSRRLTVLLEAIAGLANAPGVHIVASSRSFEFRHDPRFDRIEAETVFLESPPWDEVASVLAAHGIDPSGWQQDRREAMRAPQALSTFLALAADLGTSANVASTYQGMLDQIWDSRLASPSSRALVTDMALTMAEEESLHQPLARWRERGSALDEAISVGILWAMPDGLRVSFRHQTLFDHAVARAFVQRGAHLREYVRDHQDSLFPRPRIWSVLTYLRGAAPETYRAEFEAIWSRQDLRLHLRHLLIDFLGAQVDSTPQEQSLLLPCFDNDLAMKAARSTAGTHGWFPVIAVHKLSDLMMADPPRLHAAIHLMMRGLELDRGTVLQMMERLWTGSRLRHRVSILGELKIWDDQAVVLAMPLATDEAVTDGGICWLATVMGQARPDDAALLCVERLKWRTLPLMEADRNASPHDQAENPLNALARENNTTRYLQNINNGWYYLAAIAEAAPVTFLNAAGPWFLEAMRHSVWDGHWDEFLHSRLQSSFGEGNRPENDILAAIYAALQGYVTRDPEEFVLATAAWRTSEVDIVHSLLARAWEIIGEDRPDLLVDYLLEDYRRFRLGDSTGDAKHLESGRLIRSVCASGVSSQIERLFDAIAGWTEPRPDWYGDTPERKRQWGQRLREERLQLMTAFPTAALDDRRRRMVDEEARALGDAFVEEADHGRFRGLREVTSPMSADAMLAATDIQVETFMTKYAAVSSPGLGFIGSHGPANSAFAAFTEKAPARAAAILDRLPADDFRETMECALNPLSSSMARDDFFAFVRRQLQRGYDSTEFVRRLASACRGKASQPDGLPEDLLALFAAHLCDAEERVGEGTRNLDNADRERPPSAILWGMGRMALVPHGNYPLLSALWWGNLMKDPRRPDEGLRHAIGHLASRERAEVWRHYIGFDLEYVHLCDRSLARGFIDHVLSGSSDIAGSSEATLLVARSWAWSSSGDYLRWARLILESGWHQGRQAFGELVGLRHLLQPEDGEVADQVAALLVSFADGCDEERAGLAHAAANLWCEADMRRAASDVLCRLAATSDQHTAHAVIDAFRVVRAPLIADAATCDLLRALVTGGIMRYSKPGPFLVSGLIDVVTVLPEEVVAVALSIIDNCSLETGWRSDAHELIHVSLALQRLGENWRIAGISLFDELLRREASGVDDVLTDLDGARRSVGSASPGRLRRHRR